MQYLYEDGDGNLINFIHAIDKLYLKDTPFTEAQATTLSIFLTVVNALQFENVEFQGESFSILSESLKKCEKVRKLQECQD